MILERWTLSNGLTVLYQRDRTFPLACATLLFRIGSRHEAKTEAGLCSLTLDLLMQGTRRRSAMQLADVMESVGASMGTQVHEDYSEMGFIVPSLELDRAFGVLSEVLREPAFPAEEIVKEKAHILAGLASRHDAIFNVAYDALNRTMFGEHAYGRLVEGSEGTVKRFTRADFHRWHAAHVRPEAAVLSLVGPMPAREAKKVVEKHLEKWQGRLSGRHPGENRGPVHTEPLDPGFRRDDVVIKSNFEQAYLMIGLPAPSLRHREHLPLKVLNTLLGGGMSSRLFTILREEAGLAYEVSSFYPTRLESSQWVVYLGLPKEKLRQASRRLDLLLKQLARQGPTAEEVRQAKAMIRGAFLMDRQSHRRQAWYQAWWEFLGRGPRYGEEFLKAVDAVTPGQLQTLLQTILKQTKVTVTVVPK